MAAPKPSLRVMLDANVLIAGIGWPRWPYALLQHAIAGDFQLVLSPYVIEEARRHLQRIVPDALPYFEEILQLTEYETAADPAPGVIAANRQLVRDVKDIPVALAAMDAAVDCLVSSDKDLTDNAPLKQHVAVLLPAVFLRVYMGWTSEELEAIRQRTWHDMQ